MGVLYRIVHRHGTEIKQLVLPSILKNRVLTSLHDECGHQRVERTFELVRTRCFWPSLFKDVTNYCKQCQRCRLSKEHFPKLKTTMKHLVATQPNELVCMDFTMLEKSDDGIENVLVITDAFTNGLGLFQPGTRQLKELPRFWSRNGFLNMEYQRGCIQIKAGILRASSFNNCAPCMG